MRPSDGYSINDLPLHVLEITVSTQYDSGSYWELAVWLFLLQVEAAHLRMLTFITPPPSSHSIAENVVSIILTYDCDRNLLVASRFHYVYRAGPVRLQTRAPSKQDLDQAAQNPRRAPKW